MHKEVPNLSPIFSPQRAKPRHNVVLACFQKVHSDSTRVLKMFPPPVAAGSTSHDPNTDSCSMLDESEMQDFKYLSTAVIF